MKLSISVTLFVVALILVVNDATAKKQGRRRRGGSFDIGRRRRGSGSGGRRRRGNGLRPPASACQGCREECLPQLGVGGCDASTALTDGSCWFCGTSKDDPIAPTEACDCGPFSTGCDVINSCLFSEANINTECWQCQEPPTGSCSDSCDAGDGDQCLFDKDCGDSNASACYFCSANGGSPNAPFDACGQCGGPTSEDCHRIEQNGEELCGRAESYLSAACWECDEDPGSGSTQPPLTTTRDGRRRRGGRRNQRRRRKRN